MSDSRSFTETVLDNIFLLENIQGGIVYSDFDPPFHLRYATEGMAKLSGYSTDEITDMLQMDLVHEDDAAKLVADVGEQFAKGDTFEVEYRLKRKDGSYVYVLDRAKVVAHDDGRKYIHCILTDISDLKDMEKALRLNEEKYKLAIQQSGNVILEYNTLTTNLSFSENYQQHFNCVAPSGKLAQIIQSGWVDEQCGKQLIALFDEVMQKATTCSMELQVWTRDKHQIWCSLYLIPVINDGHMYSIIGCLENIDDKKHELEMLTELSQKDGLTGVYNRYAVEKFVRERIEGLCPTDTAALLILDIDYFKHINDEKGHDYGDSVLIQLAAVVGGFLPQNAILGRLGGDEFLIFLTLKRDTAALEELSSGVVHAVKTRFAQGEIPVTISMGAAWHTDTCNTFMELYRNADTALYETKKRGRDGYTVFQD